MSSKDIARRATAEFSFAGANITSSIRPYLLSVTYTDNEEDESDDLQIKLQDRDDIWLSKWLGDIIDAAASSAPTAQESTAPASDTYKVTAKSGLNVRTGPSTSYQKLGVLVCGAEIQITGFNGGWGITAYGGQTAYVAGNYIVKVEGTAAADVPVTRSTGFKIQAVLVRQNWHGDGSDAVLDCGQFEVDSVDASGPPNIITIKATALPYTAQIRQTKKTKAWEAYKLSGIAAEMAAANGMTCLYLSASDPYYDRAEQFMISDIAFLSDLSHDAGISLKATNNIIVLFDQADYEAKPAAITIWRGDGSYTKHKLMVGAAESEYSSCRVSYTDPATGKCITATAKVEDYKEDSKTNQQLEVTAKVASVAEAKSLAEKRLRLHNKYEKTASFTMPGNPALVAGITVELKGWGAWSGKYIVKQAKHTVGNNGYTTQLTGGYTGYRSEGGVIYVTVCYENQNHIREQADRLRGTGEQAHFSASQ